jgi:tRNA(fMet)-specific endonuclease VapC
MASYVIKDNIPAVRKHLLSCSMNIVCVSVITEAELIFGSLKKPHNIGLKTAVHEFLIRVDIVPWDSEAAHQYAYLRALLEEQGKSMGNMDMMIAACALSVGAILVSNDRVFRQLSRYHKDFKLVDWTK